MTSRQTAANVSTWGNDGPGPPASCSLKAIVENVLKMTHDLERSSSSNKKPFVSSTGTDSSVVQWGVWVGRRGPPPRFLPEATI